MRLNVFRPALLAIAACGAFAMSLASAQAQGCNCSRPVYVAPRPAQVCATACLTPSEWAACPTKSWWADSRDHRFRTPRFYSRCGTVCRPVGTPHMGYLTSGGRWVKFYFGPGS